MLADVSLTAWLAIVGPTLGALAGIARGLWQLSQSFAQFRIEHRELVADQKARTEQLERATAGVSVLPESPAVREALNGG